MSASPVLPPVRDVFRAVVQTVVPRAHGFGADDWRRAEALVEEALSRRPPGVRGQIVTFLRVLNALPVPRYLRTFAGLSTSRRVGVLRWLERSPVLLLRRGVWGVRTLSFLAVYGQDSVRAAIGYRADPRGWDARPEAQTAAGRIGGSGESGADPGSLR